MNALYRGKRIDNGEWVYGVPHTTVRQMLIVSSEIDDWGEDYIAPDYWEVDPSTVGQYTGLKDKNGEKAFAGSEFYSEEWEAEFTIEWDGKLLAWIAVAKSGYPEYLKDIWNESCEVIGSIHDKEANQ